MSIGKEIERKYLLKGDFHPWVKSSQKIAQGYLSTDPQRTVRIRLKDQKGYLTIKGESSADGTQRLEWEIEIPLDQAQELLKLSLKGAIEKTRHLITFAGRTWEIDEFHGDNDGLIIAEIELSDSSILPELPDFIGKEVTGDPRYYNSYLSIHPFRTWT